MKKKQNRKKKADQLFSRYIRERDQRCARCGKTEDLQCSHFVSRRYLATRWDPENACAKCRGCHLFFTVRPLEYEGWLLDRLGPAKLGELKAKAMTITKVDYEALMQWLNSLGRR